MEKVRTTTGRYYDRVEIRSETRQRPISSFLPRPQLKPNMRPGDVLREYKRVIQQAYKNARDLRLSLSAQVDTLTQTQFDQVNGLVKEINATRDQYSRETGDPFTDFPRLALIDANQLRPQKQDPPARQSAQGDEPAPSYWSNPNLRSGDGSYPELFPTDNPYKPRKRPASPEASDDQGATEQTIALAGTQWEASGTYIADLTLWFKEGGVLAYRTSGSNFTDGHWSASGAQVQFSIPFLDYEVRGQIANGRLQSQATPSTRGSQQGVVRSSFLMRKVSH